MSLECLLDCERGTSHLFGQIFRRHPHGKSYVRICQSGPKTVFHLQAGAQRHTQPWRLRTAWRTTHDDCIQGRRMDRRHEASPKSQLRFLFLSWFANAMLVLLWYYVRFVLFPFRLFAFLKVAALRSIVLRPSMCMRPDSHTQLPNNCLCPLWFFFLWFFFCLFGDIAFSVYFCTIAVFSLYGEYFLRFSLPDCVFFDLASTDCFFYINFCENSINQSIHQPIIDQYSSPITSITSHLPGIVSVHDQRRSAHVFCACAQSHGRLPDLNSLRSLDSWTV